MGVPATSTVGRNVAAGAERDVGAISTVLKSSSSSACTTIPGRAPCCSCPRARRGAPSRTTSPRTINQQATAVRARRALHVAPQAQHDPSDQLPVGVPPPEARPADACARGPPSTRSVPLGNRSSPRRAAPPAQLRSPHRVGHGGHETHVECTTNHATGDKVARASRASPPQARQTGSARRDTGATGRARWPANTAARSAARAGSKDARLQMRWRRAHSGS